MGTLIRVAAVVVLALVAVLLAGQGGWLLDVADRLAGGADPPPGGRGMPSRQAVTVGLAAGAGAVAVRPVGRVVGQLVTLLHELGHTLLAAAMGARPAGIVLRHDASGHARARWQRAPGRTRRLSLALTAVVGLPAPAVAAAAGAGLLEAAGPRAVLWSLVAAGVVVALLARSPWSLLVAAGLAGLALAALREAAEPWAVGAVVALLSAVALASALDAFRRLGRPIPDGDDARAVHRTVALPPRLVQLVQVAATGAASAWTVWLLLTAAGVDLGPG